MLEISHALALDHKLLLLDEPSIGLAPILVDEVFKIIERLKSEDISILLVEQFAVATSKAVDDGYH
jgi:branched-chain amino acid transport system ATP-binding protein